MALLGNELDLYTLKYTDAIEMELQQRGSRLDHTVTIESGLMGDRVYFNRMGSLNNVKERTSRWADIEADTATYERRYVTPRSLFSAHFVDEMDILRGVSPTSSIVQSAVEGMARKKDAVIFNALGGAAGVERAGTASTQAFLSGNTLAVNDSTSNGYAGIDSTGTALTGNQSLHDGKLLHALYILEKEYVNPADEDIFVVGSSKQMTALRSRLNKNNWGRKDFMEKAPLTIPGLVKSLDGFLGLRFIQYEPLSDTENLSGGNEYVYVYSSKAIKMGEWKPLNVSVDVRKDKEDFPFQIATSMTIGAVRMDEKKIVRILCA